MSLSINYAFHKIVVNEPAFTSYYNEIFKKTDPESYFDNIRKEIKSLIRELITDSKIAVGIRIIPDTQLYKPLVQRRLKGDDVVYMIRELGPGGEGIFDSFTKDGEDLKLTPKGRAWAFQQGSPSKAAAIVQKKNNYFSIPAKASPKVKQLLSEINDLPDSENFANLIGHQLRTVLRLILIYFCNQVLANASVRTGLDLRELLLHTFNKCSEQKKNTIATEINELRDNKFKEIIDDVVHDDHTLVNQKIIDEFMARMTHLISLIYRN